MGYTLFYFVKRSKLLLQYYAYTVFSTNGAHTGKSFSYETLNPLLIKVNMESHVPHNLSCIDLHFDGIAFIV